MLTEVILRSCFELLEMFFEVKKTSDKQFKTASYFRLLPLECYCLYAVSFI